MNGSDDIAFYRAALDAVPSPLFVVDDDMRIEAFNAAAGAMLGERPDLALHTKGGDALHCIHSMESPGGCGASEACKTCVVRNSVGSSFRSGAPVRHPQRMRLVGSEGTRDVWLLVTASPLAGTGRPLAVLMLEDIGEMLSTQGLVPICMHCRKVRGPSDAWTPMERYLKDHLDLGLTHGLCPECREKHYSKMT